MAKHQAHTGVGAKLHEKFSAFAQATARFTGHPATFLLAVLTIVAWAVTGPLFGYSDTWQLVINTGTTIVTFLMVFLIQATQNRDTLALQIKLSELILAHKGAQNSMASLEDLSDDELEALHDECRHRADTVLTERRSRSRGRDATHHKRSTARKSPARRAARRN